MPIIFFVRCKSRMSERDVIFPESLVRERNTGEKEGREGRKPADQFLDTAQKFPRTLERSPTADAAIRFRLISSLIPLYLFLSLAQSLPPPPRPLPRHPRTYFPLLYHITRRRLLLFFFFFLLLLPPLLPPLPPPPPLLFFSFFSLDEFSILYRWGTSEKIKRLAGRKDETL